MSEQTNREQTAAWHRRFAVDANNRAWALSEQSLLTFDEQCELLHAAHAAAHHWSKVGTPSQIAHAALLVGWVHAMLGHGELAMQFAKTAFDAIHAGAAQPWETALAHAVMADAAAAAGDADLHRRHYAQAKAHGELLSDPQDQEVFRATFDLVRAPREH